MTPFPMPGNTQSNREPTRPKHPRSWLGNSTVDDSGQNGSRRKIAFGVLPHPSSHDQLLQGNLLAFDELGELDEPDEPRTKAVFSHRGGARRLQLRSDPGDLVAGCVHGYDRVLAERRAEQREFRCSGQSPKDIGPIAQARGAKADAPYRAFCWIRIQCQNLNGSRRVNGA